MSFFRFLLISLVIVTTLYSEKIQVDSISFTKIKKLVEKEELIAKAYKNYVRAEGNTASLNTLISNNQYLPEGFSKFNLFGKEIQIDTSKNEIKNSLFRKNINDNKIAFNLKPNVYDYYYSNKYRKYTKSPINLNNKNILINLDSNEKYILKFKDVITKDKISAINKYYLDSKGLLHWYDENNNYKFTLAKDLLLDETIEIFNSDGTIKSTFTNLFVNKDVLYAGQTLFHPNNNSVDEYLHLGNGNGIIKVGKDERDIGKTILQFTRRSGGIIVNGDLYTWGNNGNKIVATGKNEYINKKNNQGNGKALITTLVRAKAKSYNSTFDNKNYFSSPLRPKFIDFTSDVWHSTCGVSTKGELYCAGNNALESNPISLEGYTKGSYSNVEYLYRSKFFNGTSNKAFKLFPLNSTYMILGKPANDLEDGYLMYFWGTNNSRGWGASGKRNETNVSTPKKASDIRFKDITFTLTIRYRRIGGLSTSGDIYTWGLDNNITPLNTCYQQLDGKTQNLCAPLKVETNIKFVSILGGQQTFLATDKDGKYYRISQAYGKRAVVDNINDLIKSYSEYKAEDDSEIIAVDITSKLIGGQIKQYESYGKGIVWINSKNQLKGDYFTSENRNDDFFKAAISKIKWKKIRMVEDKNGMCGIDIYNQMYCWGAMSFYAGTNANGNTFMLPVFNSNLHDLDKDFLLAAGGYADNKSSNVTNMTSGDWSRGSKGEFFMKYPTYIGGFNYEFTFK